MLGILFPAGMFPKLSTEVETPELEVDPSNGFELVFGSVREESCSRALIIGGIPFRSFEKVRSLWEQSSSDFSWGESC